MRDISITIDIDAPPEVAWAVLVDFPGHAAWDPFIVRLEGEAVVDRRLVVQLAPPGGRAMTFRPTVTAVEPGHRLEWLGHLGVGGLFDGRHEFVLDPLPQGRCRLTHREAFSGLLVPVLWPWTADPTRAGFEAFNRAFALRCAEAAVGERSAGSHDGPPGA